MSTTNDAPLVGEVEEPPDPLTDPLTTVAIFTSDDVRTIAPESTVAEAAAEMVAADLGFLVVGDRTRVEGVVSERDVVRAVAAGNDLTSMPVRELETMSLVWCDRDASVADVAELMLEHYVRHVLVEDAGHLVGVVSARDLLGVFASSR